MPGDLVPGESSLPGLADGHLLGVPSYGQDRNLSLSLPLLRRPIGLGPYFYGFFNLDCLIKTLFPDKLHWELGL